MRIVSLHGDARSAMLPGLAVYSHCFVVPRDVPPAVAAAAARQPPGQLRTRFTTCFLVVSRALISYQDYHMLFPSPPGSRGTTAHSAAGTCQHTHSTRVNIDGVCLGWMGGRWMRGVHARAYGM